MYVSFVVISFIEAPVISAAATYWPSIVSFMNDNINPLVETVVDDVSSLDSQFYCVLPSTHPFTLVVT